MIPSISICSPYFYKKEAIPIFYDETTDFC